MDETQRVAITPVEQATISFYGYPVIAVKLPDGRIGAVVRTMCEALQMERYSQVRRIREDETIADSLVLVQVETNGGPQATDVLTAWAIPYWLGGIQLHRVAQEKREAILAFKREAADVLYRHFSQRSALSASTTIVPAEPRQPAQPQPDALASEWADYHEQMALFYRWKSTVDQRLNDLDQWKGTVESRLEGVEEISRLVPELMERLGPQTLSPEHQSTVQASVKRLYELTGESRGAIYDALRQTFHVGKYAEIPDSEWPQVTAWFKSRIEAARKQEKK